MTERLLQYIWQFQYFNRTHLKTTEGEDVQVIFPGTINRNQGPDFLGAKIKIGSTVLAGTVELHTRTSEWERHGHSGDQNFRNVILHVVYQHDVSTSVLPVLELQPHISTIMLSKYNNLMEANAFVSCGNMLHAVKDITWLSWKERLLAERLTKKADKVFSLLQQNGNHWAEVFWIMLARSFGTKVNADAFESIAKSVSVIALAKQKASIHQIEALLLGQAGLLADAVEDQYYQLLQREYSFLKKKYSLSPIAFPVHFLRMRPGNFPTIRLTQLAMLVHSSRHLFSTIRETDSVSNLKSLLGVTANDYWHYHYQFGQTSDFKKKTLGNAAIEIIIINCIVPMLFAYGSYHRDEKQKLKALQWLEQLTSEANTVVAGFKGLAVASKTAYDSQALLELKNEYCNKKRCLECSVGNSLLKN